MMEYGLLFISFLTHAITFIIIRQLKNKLDQPSQIQENLTKQQKEIEELLAVYLLEIREENEKLLEHIENNGALTKPKEVAGDRQSHQTQQQSGVENVDNRDKYQDYQPPVQPEQEEHVEQSLAAQVLALHAKGETIEAIAKKLNRGKTEVELLVKFQQKNK
ncbi:DUF6115 domain-containing protein [Amphibacillus cookii]|uniref:DUF6115 domain-containing protein n=1 Tax=Amphibacillus cookii TaxID=767787 RepID=UPI00195E4C00|nr:hypothetical protein [Amphibacillus cookii]MBM7540599.1 hypothetical protein [Amphibacillus cookii]